MPNWIISSELAQESKIIFILISKILEIYWAWARARIEGWKVPEQVGSKMASLDLDRHCFSLFTPQNVIDQGGLKTRSTYFSQVWKLGRPRSWHWQIWYLGRSFWLIDSLLLAVSLHGGKGKGSLWGLFYMSMNPLMRPSSSWPNHLPKALF